MTKEHSNTMKRMISRIGTLALVAAFSLGLTTTALGQTEYEDQYDQQQWWNPGDWFDDTPMTNTWDYDYDWNDSDWFGYGEDEGLGYGSDLYDEDYGFGESELYDDYNYGGAEWHDDFDYDYGF